MTFFKYTIAAVILFVGYIGLLGHVFQRAEAQTASTDIITHGGGFAVVELFTSQGCSSCPPADRFLNDLSALAEENPDLRLYPLSFHVDYWDYIGWKDPFAKEEFSTRQREYRLRQGRSNVYTPQMVVNGDKQFVGNNRGEGAFVINKFLQDTDRSAPQIELKNAVPKFDKINVSYAIKGNLKANHSVLVAVVENDLVTKIKRGENRGKTLTQQNVVRHLQRVAANEHGAITIDYPAGKNLSLIAFVQSDRTSRIVAATQRDL